MQKIPTLYNNYQELMLDLDIYGKITAIPTPTLDELRDLYFEEFKQRKPFPTLEGKRYELSDLVSPEYKIAYSEMLELNENETLVDFSSNEKIKVDSNISFDDLTPLLSSVSEMFSYENTIKDADRKAIMEKYDISSGEEFQQGVLQTEKLFGSVTEDTSTVLSEEEIDNIGKIQDEELQVEYEVDDGVNLDNYDDYDSYDEDTDDNNEYNEESVNYSDDYDTNNNNEDTYSGDYSDEDEDEYDDYYYEDDEDIEDNYNDSEESSDFESIETSDEDEDDYDDDYSYEDEDNYDDDYSEDDEDTGNNSDNEYDNSDEDEDNYDDDYFEDNEDEYDSDYSDKDESDYDDDYSSDVEEEDDFVELSHVENVDNSLESDNIIFSETNNYQEKSLSSKDNSDEFDIDVDDVDVEFISEENLNKVVEIPTTPAQVSQVKPTQEQAINREEEPTDLRKFLRKHPRCDMSFALQYFSKKEINDAIKIGKIIKKDGKLRI